MKNLNAYFISMLSIALTSTFIGCAHESVQSDDKLSDSQSSWTSPSDADLESRHYIVITYEKGATALTEDDRNDIHNLIETQYTEGPIGRVEVAVWPDQILPPDGPAPSKEDRDLVNARITDLRNILMDSLYVSSVRTFNMAEGLNSLAKLLDRNPGELQSVFSKEGSAPPVTEDTFDAAKNEGGPSRAIVSVVLTKYEDY